MAQFPEQPNPETNPLPEGLVLRGETANYVFEIGQSMVQVKGEDAVLVDAQNGVVGVFDGAGGVGDGANASQAASRGVHAILSTARPRSPEEGIDTIKAAFAEGRHRVRQESTGETTAVAGWFVPIRNKLYLIGANAGDCRMFISNPGEGTLLELTKEQSVAARKRRESKPVLSTDQAELYNNFNRDEGPNVAADDEIITYIMQPGDRLIQFSDGVGGDTDWQLLSYDELFICSLAGSPQEVADALVAASRKGYDDQSALVIAITRHEIAKTPLRPNVVQKALGYLASLVSLDPKRDRA